MTRLRRYAGRVEFFAVKEEIQELIQKGYGYKMIHEKLTADKKITMTYTTFYHYLRPGKKSAQNEKPKCEDQPTIRIIKDPEEQKERFI